MKGITLHQMQVFEAVARHRSYTKAAAELYLSQPTVSIQVKQLSKVVGFPIVESVGKKVCLTAAGETLLSTCQEVLAQLTTLDQAMTAFQRLESGVVKLATVESGKCLMVKQFRPFMERYPGLDVSLYVGNRQDLIERLENNEDDLYLISLPPELETVEALPCMDNPLSVVAHAEHPLAQQTDIPPARLAKETWIFREPGSATRLLTEQFFATHRLTVSSNLEFNSNEAIKASIRAGLGIAILPNSCFSQRERQAEFALLSVAGFSLRSQWHIAYLKDKSLPPAAKAFLDYLLESLQGVPQAVG